jgi:hypothetical protein
MKTSQDQVEEAVAPRLLRSRAPSSTISTSKLPEAVDLKRSESRIPVKLPPKAGIGNNKLAETLRNISDNLNLALNTPPKRLSSAFRKL